MPALEFEIVRILRKRAVAQGVGFSQMEVAVDYRREHAWADRIAANPQATHLAVELLH